MNVTNNKKININDLNSLRVFALSMVILRHSFAPFLGSWGLDQIYEQSDQTKIIGEYVSTISMPLYVFISGVLFSFLRNSLNKYPNYRILIQKKTKRLIRPYLIIAPLYIFFFTDISSVSEFLIKFWKGAGHLWFLLMIFTVFLIFYPLEKYFKKNALKGFLIMIGLYFINPIVWYIGAYPISLAFKYITFFYVGYFFFFNSVEILNFLNKKLFLLIFSHSYDTHNLTSWFQVLTFLPMGILSVSFIFILFSKMTYKKSIHINSSVKNINDMSYYMYIFHQPLLMLFFTLPFLTEWKNPFVIIISFLFVFITSLILGNIIMSFKIGKKLIGAK